MKRSQLFIAVLAAVAVAVVAVLSAGGDDSSDQGSETASTERANQERLAGDVRALREEVGAVATGMSEAYETG